jgi:lipopolysaccharide/colanic/teichoic acid biosynthesis glycosyltransferase
LAQLNWRRDKGEIDEVIDSGLMFDLEYVKRSSPSLDLKIIWRTILALFTDADRSREL